MRGLFIASVLLLLAEPALATPDVESYDPTVLVREDDLEVDALFRFSADPGSSRASRHRSGRRASNARAFLQIRNRFLICRNAAQREPMPFSRSHLASAEVEALSASMAGDSPSISRSSFAISPRRRDAAEGADSAGPTARSARAASRR